MNRIITEQLESLARETVEYDGDRVTRAEALGRLIWKLACGYEITDPNCPDRKLSFKPAEWAVKLLAERLEGRVPHLTTEDAHGGAGFRLTEMIEDMAAQRDKVNAIVAKIGVDDEPA